MTTLPERDQVMTMVAEAIGAGARQERACEAISLSERTLQRWHHDRVEGACWPSPTRPNSATSRQAKSCLGWLIRASMSPQSRPSIAC